MAPAPPRNFEVVVLGGGPAGLSAGLVLGRCLRHTLICDDGHYRNRRSEALHCFIGHDGVAPADLRQRCHHELARYETVSIAARTARTLRRDGSAFVVEFVDHARVSAGALLVATGVFDELPPVEGLAALFGRSVHVCPIAMVGSIVMPRWPCTAGVKKAPTSQVCCGSGPMIWCCAATARRSSRN